MQAAPIGTVASGHRTATGQCCNHRALRVPVIGQLAANEEFKRQPYGLAAPRNVLDQFRGEARKFQRLLNTHAVDALGGGQLRHVGHTAGVEQLLPEEGPCQGLHQRWVGSSSLPRLCATLSTGLNDHLVRPVPHDAHRDEGGELHIGVGGLLKGLGDETALLQYYITENRVGMLLTTPGVQLARSSSIDSKELNRKIGELRRLLQDPKSNPLPVAQALYQILVAPIAKDLEEAGAKTVMLSLDGALRYLPFSALHDGKQYLVQRWNLPLYTSVTKDKLRDSVSAQWQAAGLGVTREWPDFKPLAGVKAEMGGIVKTAAGGVMPGEVYLDEAFTALRLKDVSQRKFPLVHVASHFRFSPGTEVNSFLLLGDGERLTLGDIRTQNYRFDNVDLLTLSACDTGLGGGRDEQGREIEGFGVIAQQQGAKAVLATLWPVADQSTAMLMADLYRRRQSNSLTKIEAIRQSQIALQSQSKYVHPYYWAPFILMGNWKWLIKTIV